MLRIAVQAKGRLYDETMSFLGESDIKLSAMKRSLLVQSSNFPLEVLFLRDDDIPQSVATGVADIGIVGENEFVEKNEDAEIIKRLGFSKCRLSLAMPKDIEYPGVKWFHGKKIATSYPGILSGFLKENGVNAEIHVITGSVEVAPGIGLADAIFDIVSSGSTLVSNRLKEVEVVMKSEALLIGNRNLSEEKQEILRELLFRMDAVKTAEDKKYVLMNAPKEKLDEIVSVLPGMKSPTVMPLAQEGWCSVHTVLDEKCFWEIIGKLKRPYVRYTRADEKNVLKADCLIIDCFGLLSSIYRYGEIAYIGGGFGVGIHNTLEAAVYGIPVIFGPKYQKFMEAIQLLETKGAYSIKDYTELDTLLNRFHTDVAFLNETGEKAGNYVTGNAGATEKIMHMINF